MVDAGRDQHRVRRASGEAREAGGGEQLVVEVEQLAAEQRPRLVLVPPVPGAAAAADVHRPARGEEVGERVVLHRAPRCGGRRSGSAGRAAPSSRSEAYRSVAPVRSPRIRAQRYGRPSATRAASTGSRCCGVEAAEHDAPPPVVVDGVQPHVRLEEGAEPRHDGQRRERGALEPERDQPDPGRAVRRRVRPRPGRQPAGDLGRDRRASAGTPRRASAAGSTARPGSAGAAGVIASACCTESIIPWRIPVRSR